MFSKLILITVSLFALAAIKAEAEVLVLGHATIQQREREYVSCRAAVKAEAVARQAKQKGRIEPQAVIIGRIQSKCGITKKECEGMIINRLNQVSKARPLTDSFIAQELSSCANNPET